jgi:hypothetical protein
VPFLNRFDGVNKAEIKIVCDYPKLPLSVVYISVREGGIVEEEMQADTLNNNQSPTSYDQVT